ncbi:unnamed protein product [Rotaria sordida]|uniref:Uncharacterized protein n=1 Tax=Rotaria sordida TaxID=392033 RepID=A0A818U744_9BILA|nr:unnamed protein product [Rotaria sordida]
MINSNSNYPQLSDWSTEQNSVSQNRYTLDNDNSKNSALSSNHWFDNNIKDGANDLENQKCHLPSKFLRFCSFIPICLRGLILGLLVGGLALSVIIPLWLATTNTTTIVSTTTSTASTSSTAVTTASTTMTSSSSSSTVTSASTTVTSSSSSTLTSKL